MRQYRRARRQDEKQDRIDGILLAARNRLDQHAIQQCNLHDIAADVGITKAALYRYFRAKELIFIEIYRQELEETCDDLRDALLDGAPFDALTLGNVLARHPRFCTLLTQLSGTLLPVLQPAEREVLQQFERNTWLTVLCALQARFTLTACNAELLIHHWLIAVAGCGSLAAEGLPMVAECEHAAPQPLAARLTEQCQPWFARLEDRQGKAPEVTKIPLAR